MLESSKGKIMAFVSAHIKRNPSILKAILNRQTYGANVLHDVRMIRTMIESGRSFKKVFDMPSKSPIVYMADGLYFNSFATCFDLTNLKGKPQIVYSLQRRSLSITSMYKTEEMMVFESPLDQTTFSKVQGTFYANGPYLIGVTADNYLKVFDVKTGKSLREVYLQSGRKFKYLSWETDLERLVARSTLFIRRSSANTMQRLPTQMDHAVVYFAIFSVTPVEFICMLPISPKIFGADVCNASVRNGILFVAYRRQNVQLFSLEDILKNHTIPLQLGDSLKPGNNVCLPEMDEYMSGIIGEAPLGLPVNVTLLEKPGVLLDIVSNHGEWSFGGYPWHYITNIKDVFHVKSIKDQSLAENGSLMNEVKLSLDADKAFFHPDSSGRVLYITSAYLRCLKLIPASLQPESATYKLDEQFILDYRLPTYVSNFVYETKSGRKVKNLFYDDVLELEVIQDFDYDDELDLLVLLHLSRDTARREAIVGFFDNQTGRLLRDLHIDDMGEEAEHSIAIDRSTLVVMSKIGSSFRCQVYILTI